MPYSLTAAVVVVVAAVERPDCSRSDWLLGWPLELRPIRPDMYTYYSIYLFERLSYTTQ